MQSYLISKNQNAQMAISKNNSSSYGELYAARLLLLREIKNNLAYELQRVQEDSLKPIDLMMKQKTIFKERDFTSILCEGDSILQFNPRLSGEAV
jgi:hypothetical protein